MWNWHPRYKRGQLVCNPPQMGRYVPSKTERNPREHKLLLYSSEHDSPPCITTRQGEHSDSDHTAKQIVYPKRTDGKLLLLKICKSRK